MKRRIPALLLAVVLLLSVPALAALDGMDRFVRGRTYTGQFPDVAPGSVFYGNVSSLYEYGLAGGKEDGTFGLTDPLSVGQATIFAARIRSIYRTGDPERGPAAYLGERPLALGYLRYLQAEGAPLGAELEGVLTQPATRAQTAHILAGALPQEALPPINDAVVTQSYAARQAITDVTEYTPYYWDILFLYRCGVCAGSDSTGSFRPDAHITRGAAAAMVARLVDPAQRIVLDWGNSAQGRTLASLVEPGSYIASPLTADELDETVRHMLSTNSDTLELRYSGLTQSTVQQLMERTLAVVKSYCEQSYNSASATYTTLGNTVRLTFSAAELGDRIQEYREQAMADAIAVHDHLWAEGTIDASMTEREKALVYFTWICEHCVYDHSPSVPAVDHIAYGLFRNGTAVCDGYTGAYNMLLKLEGIQCSALSNSEHIWTVATLDGTEVHIDVTWGDNNGVVEYRYFAMSPAQSWQAHSW